MTGKRNKPCPFCERSFKNGESLEQHINDMHPKNANSYTARKWIGYAKNGW